MNYLKNFEKVSQYEAYISGSPMLPNVSTIEETHSVGYKSIRLAREITVDSFIYSPSLVSYSGGTSTPSVTYTIKYSDGTISHDDDVKIAYVKNSGEGSLDMKTGVVTWDENSVSTQRNTNVSVYVRKDTVEGITSVNCIQEGRPVATSITINNFVYSNEVESSGGTSEPTIEYTIYYSNGATSGSGATLVFSKNSGEASIDATSGIVTWNANMTLSTRTSNFKVTVSKDDVSVDKSTDNIQKDGHGTVGEIIYWDGSMLKYSPESAWTSDLGTPVGVCVVPKTHMSDNKARYVALSGSTEKKWGPTNVETELENYGKVPTWNNTTGGTIGNNAYGYMSSDKFTSGIQNVIDTKTYYDKNYYSTTISILSPYNQDETHNPNYSSAFTGNLLSDFNGKYNTQILSQKGGDFEGAHICNDFATSGLSAGTWYLPAGGELGYLISRFNIINSGLTKCSGTTIGSNIYVWSSNEFGQSQAYGLYMSSGCFGHYDKDYKGTIRPFVAL